MKRVISLLLVLSMVLLMSVPVAYADNGKGNGNSGKGFSDEEYDDDELDPYAGLPYGLRKKAILPPGLFNKETLPSGLAKRIVGSEQITEFYMKRLDNIVKILEERLADESEYLIPETLETEILAFIAGLEDVENIDDIMDAIIQGRTLIKSIDEQRLATEEEIQRYLDIFTEVTLEMVLHLEANENIDETEEWIALVNWIDTLPIYETTSEVAFQILEEHIDMLEELVEEIEPPLTLTDGLFNLEVEDGDESSDDESSDDESSDDE